MTQLWLGNFCFVLLLITMVSYWWQACFLYNQRLHEINLSATGLASFVLFLVMALRWQQTGQYPVTNLYESLVFLCWSVTLIHLVLNYTTKLPLIGALLSPLELFTIAFATYSMPQELKQTSGLVAALHSNWLIMHVTIMMLSYAALLVGCLFSFTFLIINATFKDFKEKSWFYRIGLKLIDFQKKKHNFQLVGQPALLSNLIFLNKKDSENQNSVPSFVTFNEKNLSQNINHIDGTKNQYWSQLLEALDSLSYRTLGIGFSFLTLGILSGAVWANEAWGSYWSWDPKETWAFVTWLIFATYLHIRITNGWQGAKPAFVASFGFFALWFCFLGVNLFSKGLHSYGWVLLSK